MASQSLTTVATAAAQYLGILDSGGALSTQQLNDALAAMNGVLENWSAEELMIPGLLLQVFSLTAGTASYTIGTGLTFNVVRPLEIEAAVHKNMMNGVAYDTPIKVINASEWASIDNRGQSNNLISYLFYDRALSNAKVYVSPVPLGGSIELTMWSALTQFADLTTAITLPPGYVLPLTYALAMALAPQYLMPPTEALVKNAMDATARIRDLNASLMGRKPPAGQTEAATAPPSAIQTA